MKNEKNKNEKILEITRKAIAQDNGNGFVKTTIGYSENSEIFVEPSVIGIPSKEVLEIEEGKNNVFTYKGENYFFGNNVLDHGITPVNEIRNNLRRYETDEYIMTALFPLVENALSNERVEIVAEEYDKIVLTVENFICGMPVNQLEYKEGIIERFENQTFEIEMNGFPISVKFNEVLAVSEPFATAVELGLLVKKILIIDIGTGTTDVIVINKGKLFDSSDISENFGVKDLHERIALHLNGIGYRVKSVDVPEFLKRKDILENEKVKKEIRKFAEKIVSLVAAKFKNISLEFEGVVLTGGGAALLLQNEEDFIKEKLGVVSIEKNKDPQLTNVKGLRRLLILKQKKMKDKDKNKKKTI